jgi:hypothetical protein
MGVRLYGNSSTWNDVLWGNNINRQKILESGRSSFEIGDQYVTLSLDLATINYPEDIRLAFFSHSSRPVTRIYNSSLGIYNYIDCSHSDVTGYATVPPPQFQISSSPNPLELRPSEEKPVQIQIKSDASIDSVALITPNITENEIQTDLSSGVISIRPFGNSTTTLSVEALDNS